MSICVYVWYYTCIYSAAIKKASLFRSCFEMLKHERVAGRGAHDSGGYARESHARPSRLGGVSSSFVTGHRRSLSLKLSDTRVYEPQIRAVGGVCSSAGLNHKTHNIRDVGDERQTLTSVEGICYP